MTWGGMGGPQSPKMGGHGGASNRFIWDSILTIRGHQNVIKNPIYSIISKSTSYWGVNVFACINHLTGTLEATLDTFPVKGLKTLQSGNQVHLGQGPNRYRPGNKSHLSSIRGQIAFVSGTELHLVIGQNRIWVQECIPFGSQIFPDIFELTKL